MTTRTYIVIALSFLPILIWDAWKNVPTKEAVELINIWLNRDMPMTREWVYKFATLYAIPWLMALVAVIDSKGKEPLKRAMYWTWLLFFSFTFFKFLWDFDRDNYFYLFLLVPFLPFLVAVFLKHHARHDVVYEIRQFVNKLSRKPKVQASVARKDDSSTKVKYIKNYEAEVHLSD